MRERTDIYPAAALASMIAAAGQPFPYQGKILKRRYAGCGNLKLTRLANRYLCDFGEKPTQQLTREMNSNSTETATATILINDFGLKGKTFAVFKIDERNVWLLIPHEVASMLILEPNSHILASNGVAVRFPNWGIDTEDKF